MNNFERASSTEGQSIGEFSPGSKGGGSMEILNEEQRKKEKAERDLDELLQRLEDNHCGQLASYVKSLPSEKLTKIDGELNTEGKGIVDLSWTPLDRQNEMIGILEEIAQAQDIVAARNASKRVGDLLDA